MNSDDEDDFVELDWDVLEQGTGSTTDEKEQNIEEDENLQVSLLTEQADAVKVVMVPIEVEQEQEQEHVHERERASPPTAPPAIPPRPRPRLAVPPAQTPGTIAGATAGTTTGSQTYRDTFARMLVAVHCETYGPRFENTDMYRLCYYVNHAAEHNNGGDLRRWNAFIARAVSDVLHARRRKEFEYDFLAQGRKTNEVKSRARQMRDELQIANAALLTPWRGFCQGIRAFWENLCDLCNK